MKIEKELPLRTRAALYIRVSTEEQALHGLSIEAQTAALDAWAEANHVQVVGHYTDAGISARKPAAKRPELQRLLRDVQKGKVDLIAFTKLDRWFRNVSEYYKVQDILETHKVAWRTIHEDYDTSTSSGRLKVNIMLSVAEDEADRTSERIKAVFDSKRAKNELLGGVALYGYRWQDGKLVVVEKESEIVRWMFDQYISLRSRRAVAIALREQYGVVRTVTGVTLMLSNTKYIGQEDGKDGVCPPIVDRNTFALAQQISRQRSQRNSSATSNRVYLFTGIVSCAECGRRLCGRTIQGKYIYYHCNAYANNKSCTHYRRTSELQLEKWMLENVLSCADAYNLELETRRLNGRPVVDENAIRRKMDKLKDLYLNDLIERDAYERDYTALRDKLVFAQAAKENDPSPIDTSQLKSLLDIYSTLTREGKKEFWTRTVSKIIITNDGNFSIDLVLP